MEIRYDSYCGLYCGACPYLLATETGTIKEFAAMDQMPAEEAACGGCKSDVQARFCRECRMRQCARDRGLETCGACPEYPCERLTAFRHDVYPHHSVVFRNQGVIKHGGLAAWLAGQRERWRCPRCGRRFTWYDAGCEGCGADLYDCRAEEKDLDL